MKDFYFTFGQGHKHPVTGLPLKDYWLKVTAPNEKIARNTMFKMFGKKWSFSYKEELFDTSEKRAYFPKGEYLHVSCGDASLDEEELQYLRKT